MTIFFPDVSNYQAGLVIQPGTVAVVAKATEGTGYRDASFFNFEAQADRLGAVFSGYHYLHAGNGSGQADYYRAYTSRPCMIDVEAGSGGVGDVTAFMDRARANGTRVWGVYLPHWYWQQIGSPSLTPITNRGAVIVSSNYTAYSDSGPGWAGYGGADPAVWQYTSSFAYGGQRVDFNAYKGTVEQFRALVLGSAPTPPSGGNMLTPDDILNIWAYHGGDGNAGQPDDQPDVHQSVLDSRDNTAALLVAVQNLTVAVQGLSANVEAIKAKVGA